MFFPVVGGMHTLMSFVRCIGTLMTNTGLSDLLKAALEEWIKCSRERTSHKIPVHYKFVPRNF